MCASPFAVPPLYSHLSTKTAQHKNGSSKQMTKAQVSHAACSTFVLHSLSAV